MNIVIYMELPQAKRGVQCAVHPQAPGVARQPVDPQAHACILLWSSHRPSRIAGEEDKKISNEQ